MNNPHAQDITDHRFWYKNRLAAMTTNTIAQPAKRLNFNLYYIENKLPMSMLLYRGIQPFQAWLFYRGEPA